MFLKYNVTIKFILGREEEMDGGELVGPNF